MFLYAASRDVERTLKNIDKLAEARKNAVIKMTYVKLDITDHTIKRLGKETKVISRDVAPSFLVKDVQVIQEDRNL